MNIILGSQSPRRKELLENLGFQFSIADIQCEEIFPDTMSVDNVAAYLSELKSKSYPALQKNDLLITADTVVILNDKILGKPANKLEAKQMLHQLSGKPHFVDTAVSVRTHTSLVTKTDRAKVYFEEISDAEIDFYTNNFCVLDKAGSYGIQDWIGMAKISKIEGSFYTVMGFPTHMVYQLLQAFTF